VTLILILLFVCCGSHALAGEAPPEPPILAVVGGTLIDGTGADPIPDSVILIEGDRIRAAGPRRQIRIPKGAVAVDATDFTVIPGLIDMHVHLIEGVSLRTFVEYGVTSVRHLGDTTLDWILQLQKRSESRSILAPRIFHCGLFVVSEPPLVRSNYPPAELSRFLIMRSPDDARGVVKKLVESGAVVVKVKTEMSPESLRALGAAASEAGLPLTFDSGGDNAAYDALTALGAGATGIEHLSGIPFESPAVVEAALKKMLAVGAYADPTFVVLEKTYSARMVGAREEFIRKFAAEGGRVLAGTDVPTRALSPGVSLHAELAALVRAGLTNMQALRAATAVAGRALGYPGILGTIEAGAYADLVIINGDPLERIDATQHVIRVVQRGRVVHPVP
jgi:imidazolonepropionase-like amidohydrolase